MLFLALKKVRIVKITPVQIPTTQLKISSIAKFSIALTWRGFHLPLNAIGKDLNCPFAPQEGF